LDDFSSGKPENLGGLEVELLEGDIRQESIVRRAVKQVDWVFHLAALVSVTQSMQDPAGAYQTNLMGTINMLEAARQAGVKRIVLSSSCAIYGNTQGPVAEEEPAQPLSPYAGSKLAMEQVGSVYGRAYNLEVVSLRYFNVYGPRQSIHSDYAAVIPLFISQMSQGAAVTVHGDGRQTRDFIFVDDVVGANLRAVEVGVAAGSTFNIGSGQAHSILDLVKYLQQVVPEAPEPNFGPARPGDIRFSQAEISKMKRSLGFHPAIDLQTGLARTVEWFRSAQELIE
jgi:nucleoside-diphosphate-sugar epimerase